jgi:hypothetical protein
MTLARWKDLCLDAADPSVAAPFWGSALGLEVAMQDNGDAVLRGSSPGQTIWVNRVPEPKSVKNRAHLDLVGPPLGTWLDLGATVLQEVTRDPVSWTVLADPEGNEVCVFAQPDAPTALVVDSADPEGDARWWGEVLGGQLVVAPGGLRRWVTEVADLPWQVVKFVGVPEPKTGKNRVHWDVVSDDVSRLVDRGARLLRAPDDDVSWHVLADPAGNEFCVFAP